MSQKVDIVRLRPEIVSLKSYVNRAAPALGGIAEEKRRPQILPGLQGPVVEQRIVGGVIPAGDDSRKSAWRIESN